MKQVVDGLKDRPKDEKQAVAGGVAIFIVTIIFIAWAFFFFKKIARGGDVNIPFGGVQQDVVQGASLNQAKDDFLRSYNDATADLRAIRDQAAQNSAYGAPEDYANIDTDYTTSGSSGFGF